MEFNLKAIEIYEKEFTRGKKDKEFYSIQEVNDFLDLIIEDYQKIEKLTDKLSLLEEENNTLKSEVARLKGEEVLLVERTNVSDKSDELLSANNISAAVATNHLVKDEVEILSSTEEITEKEDEIQTDSIVSEGYTNHLVKDEILPSIDNTANVIQNSEEQDTLLNVENNLFTTGDVESEVTDTIVNGDTSLIESDINSEMEESQIKAESDFISGEYQNEMTNQEQTQPQEIVESLTLDDIAEIRRLMQEERAALYSRNEE